MIFYSFFQTSTLQGWKRFGTTLFFVNNSVVMVFQFVHTNPSIIGRWQRSRHVTHRTLDHHASSRNKCIGIIVTWNHSSNMVLTESWTALVVMHLIKVYNIDICNGFLVEKSCYNKISYKCELEMLFFGSLCDTRAPARIIHTGTHYWFCTMFMLYIWWKTNGMGETTTVVDIW